MIKAEINYLLEKEFSYRNSDQELTNNNPDPLMIAKRYKDEYIALICALFAYGSAKQIVKFLTSLPLDILDNSEDNIKKTLQGYYYRFQNESDVINLFLSLKRLRSAISLEELFYKSYKKEQNILEGIDNIIKTIYKYCDDYHSFGFDFLIGKPLKRNKQNQIKQTSNAPYKRYNMFLRWMIRSDNLDMGLWKAIDKNNLILPLDTHTFKVSQKLGLLTRKTYDLKSAILITEKLKEFDKNDPVKYDFALYRLGQEKIL